MSYQVSALRPIRGTSEVVVTHEEIICPVSDQGHAKGHERYTVTLWWLCAYQPMSLHPVEMSLSLSGLRFFSRSVFAALSVSHMTVNTLH